MNSTTVALIIHAVVGLAVVGAVSALGAVGTITGTQALDVIGIVVSFLLGAGAVTVGNTTSSNSAPPTPPVT
jgi:hypothetical protein